MKRDLRDRLGEALHRMAYFDSPKIWSPTDEEMGVGLGLLESSREEWRRIADRLLNEVGPACGLRIIDIKGTP